MIMGSPLHATIIMLVYVSVGLIMYAILKKFGLFKSLDQLTKRERIGRILGITVGFAFLTSSLAKTLSYSYPDVLPMIPKTIKHGLGHLIWAIFTLEITSALLLFTKKYFKLGMILAITELTGAVMSHLPEFADGILWCIPSGSLLILMWISVLLLVPEMFPDSIVKLFLGETNKKTAK